LEKLGFRRSPWLFSKKIPSLCTLLVHESGTAAGFAYVYSTYLIIPSFFLLLVFRRHSLILATWVTQFF